MDRVKLSENLEFSRLTHGMWRLAEWNMSADATLHFIEECLELGITTFDHADIYGNYSCEDLFGTALAQKPSLRSKLQLVSKCGIKLISSKHPEHKIKYYDTSKEHIVTSAEQSLKNLRTDHLDLLLIHRPDPYMNPEEVAEAFTQLKEEGKVIHFGVSNFTPSQFNMLQSYLGFPLVTNQIEISVMAIESFTNGTIDHCLEKRIPPMAWSPLEGGKFFHASDERGLRLRSTIEAIAKDLQVDSIDQILYAWLLNHPARIIPIVGSGNIDRVRSAVKSADIQLSRQQWFEILQSTTGKAVE
ncbi:aldo/keto reductase [Aneurinibacillus sp. Ricciae_BoGa-3]|uniref:aldo/keto reductase n=1 Tax=Aneurinibacillus sp. Ricciae_BoGa-3 TaxID=3022697 RepID=UPI0023416142|nr:aldo/keto reductase [Aneurinibacillus sp. Ricciae_BoGa-3]WCK56192.1 aldo/keto reductase [Aneurinibacillus sp. Ricciae_BoGa-3]